LILLVFLALWVAVSVVLGIYFVVSQHGAPETVTRRLLAVLLTLPTIVVVHLVISLWELGVELVATIRYG